MAARLTTAGALTDPTGAALPAGLHLSPPLLYLVLSPLFTLWDSISLLGMERLQAWLLGVALLYGLWRAVVLARAAFRPRRPRALMRVARELLVLMGSVVALLVFLVIGALWHRPMLALRGVPQRIIVTDFHSHTNASHDVRGLQRGFDAEANRRWHARAGFDAAFITDHNTMDGIPRLNDQESSARSGIQTVLCPGEELSLRGAHLVLLDPARPVDRTPYSADSTGLIHFLTASDSIYHAVVIASLPEYEEHFANRLGDLVTAGLDGFEIVNAAPQADRLTPPRRDSLIQLARSADRLLVGATDQHGWGATNMVWNLVRMDSVIPPAGRCTAVMNKLRTEGFEAVQVVERRHLTADAAWPLWLTPIGALWETWRGMGWLLTLSWIAWIWLVTILVGRVDR